MKQIKLRMPYTYDFPRPAVTVDAIVFSKSNGQLYVVLIKRANPPFQGDWAFPGGFVDMEESLLQAATRELSEETGLKDIALVQFYTYGDVHRDPRHRTITVVYYGFASDNLPPLAAGDDAGLAAWFPLDDLPHLAFDHDEILHQTMMKLFPYPS
jgi:8-oxo-dGTP diphosphatase